MRKLSIVVLIIGLALGTIGGILRFVTLFYGDSMLQALKTSQVELTPTMLQAQESLKKATDKSLSHVLSLVGDLAIIIAGGTLALVAASADTKKKWRIPLACAAIAAGLGLLAFRNWVCAVAYILGGFLLLTLSEKPAEDPNAPMPGEPK
jgi:hypothetical protein